MENVYIFNSRVLVKMKGGDAYALINRLASGLKMLATNKK